MLKMKRFRPKYAENERFRPKYAENEAISAEICLK
ncbi:hypothetical protein T09_3964, partial [Trichinella sp. T9]